MSVTEGSPISLLNLVGSVTGSMKLPCFDPDNPDFTMGMTPAQLATFVGGGGGGGGSPGGSNKQVQFNNAAAFGGMDLLSFDTTTKLLGLGSATNTLPVFMLDPNATEFFIDSYPLFDDLVGLQVGGVTVTSGDTSDGFGANVNIVGGNVVSSDPDNEASGGGIFIAAGSATGVVAANGSVTILVPNATPSDAPVAFSSMVGGSGYTNGTYNDLLQTGAFVLSSNVSEGASVSFTQMIVAGGAVTALNGPYNPQGTDVVDSEYTLTVVNGSVYPHDNPDDVATATLATVSAAGNAGSITLAVEGAFEFDIGDDQIVMGSDATGAYMGIDSGGNVNLNSGASGGLLLQSDAGTAGQVPISGGAGNPTVWGDAGGGDGGTSISQGGGSVSVDSSGNITGASASSAFVTFTSNGGQLTVDSAGGIEISATEGGTLSLGASAASLAIDDSGDMLLSVPSLSTFTITSNSAEFEMDDSGSVIISPASQLIINGAASSLFNIDAAGNVSLESAASAGELFLQATGEAVLANQSSGASIDLDTSGNINLSFGLGGALQLGGDTGTSGQVPVSGGAGEPTVWGTFSVDAGTQISQGGGLVGVDSSGNINGSANGGGTINLSANSAFFELFASGDATLSAADGQTAALESTGGSVAIDGSGNVTTTAATDATVQLSSNGAGLALDGSGNILLVPGGSATITLQGGDESSLSIDGSGNVLLYGGGQETNFFASASEIGLISTINTGQISIDSDGNLILTSGATGALMLQADHGTAGQVITSAGASLPATWANPAASISQGGGGVTVDSSGNVDITAAADETITLSVNGSSVLLDTDGSISFTNVTGSALLMPASGDSSFWNGVNTASLHLYNSGEVSLVDSDGSGLLFDAAGGATFGAGAGGTLTLGDDGTSTLSDHSGTALVLGADGSALLEPSSGAVFSMTTSGAIQISDVGNGFVSIDGAGNVSIGAGNSPATISMGGSSGGSIGIDGSGNIVLAPASPLSGWGTPVNDAVVNNYDASTASAADTNKVVASLLKTILALELYAA